MSLILAIEPNKNQAHQLSALVRAHLKAELVTAPTAAAALAALGDRIPDVVLTPALFGLKDEAALTERLRQLGNDASHVQTLAIPILAAAAAKGQTGGLLNRKGNKADAEVGCDPTVFAEQIKIYLQRAAVERRAQASEAAARAMNAAPPAAHDTAAPAADDLSSLMMSADELDVDSLELPSIPPPAPAPAPVAAPVAATAAPARDKSVKSDASTTPKAKPPSRTPSAIESELLVTPPASGPPLWKVTESIEDFYGQTDAAAISTPEMSVEPFPGTPIAKAAQSSSPAPRVRRTPPSPDDWAYFDPSQSAFKALIRRLDEIAGSAA